MSSPQAFTADFAAWLLPAIPNPTSELTQKRWDAVKDTAKRIGVSADDTLNTARLVLGLSTQKSAVESLRQSFVQHDPSFATNANDLEMQILAGAVLVEIMRSESPTRSLAVLSLLAGSACDARTTERNRHFVEIAKSERKRIAVRDDDADAWPVLDPAGRLGGAGATEADPDQLDHIAKFATTLSDFGGRGYARLREESSISWWVLGEYSRDLDVPVSELPPKAAPLVLAKELADLTRTEVGPVGANAVLWRMLSMNKKSLADSSFEGAIGACSAEWAGRTVSGQQPTAFDTMTPVLAGLRARHVAANGWKASYRAATGLGSDVSCAGKGLAMQLYYEMLLVRAHEEMSE